MKNHKKIVENLAQKVQYFIDNELKGTGLIVNVNESNMSVQENVSNPADYLYGIIMGCYIKNED